MAVQSFERKVENLKTKELPPWKIIKYHRTAILQQRNETANLDKKNVFVVPSPALVQAMLHLSHGRISHSRRSHILCFSWFNKRFAYEQSYKLRRYKPLYAACKDTQSICFRGLRFSHYLTNVSLIQNCTNCTIENTNCQLAEYATDFHRLCCHQGKEN